MKRTPILVAAILILVAGVIVIAMNLTGGDSGDGSTSSPNDGSSRETAGSDSVEEDGFRPASGPKATTRDEPSNAEQKLVDEYGDARTKLARSVSENVVGLLDDVISMGEMMMSGGGPDWNSGDRQIQRMLRGTEIELTDEQMEHAEALLAEHRQRELDRTKESMAELRDNPVPLMRMLLAGDARSRDELSESDYAALQQANVDALGDIINPLDRNNFRGQDPMNDDAFRDGFVSILDGDQAAAFAESQDSADSDDGDEATTTNITEMPTMSLESADEAIRSTRQMTSGFKQVMEGMGNLGPILEQQRRAREEGE